MALEKDAVERMLRHKLKMKELNQGYSVFVLEIDSRQIVKTKLSRGSAKYKTLGHDLENAMARQIRVPLSFFRELTNCSKDRNNYIDHLTKTGVI